MGRLRYTTAMSLDGYVVDGDGDFQWAAPSAEMFDLHVARTARVSTEVLGRRTYALMEYWESPPEGEEWTEAEHEFARRWREIEKVVVSSTLTPEQVTSPRARLVRDMPLDALADLVAAAEGDVEIFGPTTAADAIRAGMVDDFEFFVFPVVVGGGVRALPDDARLDLRLVEQRVFAPGTVHLLYESARGRQPVPLDT